jgi:hypothetical protein
MISKWTQSHVYPQLEVEAGGDGDKISIGESYFGFSKLVEFYFKGHQGVMRW